MTHDEMLNTYKTAKDTVDREILLEVAKDLKISFAHSYSVIIDNEISQKSGNNLTPKILNINRLFKDTSIFKNIVNAKRLSLSLYTKNENGYIMVHNKDTNLNFELGKSGIKKTFSKNVPYEKTNTANILKGIVEEGNYLFTTKNIGDDEVLYHHFLTPVKAYNSKGNAFIRYVIREFVNNLSAKNKFYYHQFEHLDNKKGLPRPVSLKNNDGQDLEAKPFSSNNIT